MFTKADVRDAIELCSRITRLQLQIRVAECARDALSGQARGPYTRKINRIIKQIKELRAAVKLTGAPSVLIPADTAKEEILADLDKIKQRYCGTIDKFAKTMSCRLINGFEITRAISWDAGDVAKAAMGYDVIKTIMDNIVIGGIEAAPGVLKDTIDILTHIQMGWTSEGSSSDGHRLVGASIAEERVDLISTKLPWIIVKLDNYLLPGYKAWKLMQDDTDEA